MEFLGSLLPLFGGIIGSFFGGPVGGVIGSLAGGLIGRAISGQSAQEQIGPRQSEFRVSASQLGIPIPQNCGRARVPGNIIAASPVQERRLEERQEDTGFLSSFLGGGGTTFVTFTYEQTVAWAVHDGELKDIPRIWLGPELYLDRRPGNTGPIGRDVNFRIHLGTAGQQPDPDLATFIDPADLSAFRGTAYVVATLNLTDFANQLPNATFEIVRSGTDIYPADPLALPSDCGWDTGPTSRATGRIFAHHPKAPFMYMAGAQGEDGYGVAKYNSDGRLLSWTCDPGDDSPYGDNPGFNDYTRLNQLGMTCDDLGNPIIVVAQSGAFNSVAKLDPYSLKWIDLAIATIPNDFNSLKIGHLAGPATRVEVKPGVFRILEPFGPFIGTRKNGADQIKLVWGGTPGKKDMDPIGTFDKGQGHWQGDYFIADLCWDALGDFWGVGGTNLVKWRMRTDALDPIGGFEVEEVAVYDLSAYGSNFNRLTFDQETFSLIIGHNDISPSLPDNHLIRFDVIDLDVVTLPDLSVFNIRLSSPRAEDDNQWVQWLSGSMALLNPTTTDMHVIDLVNGTEVVLLESDYGVNSGGTWTGGFYDPARETYWLSDQGSGQDTPFLVRLPRVDPDGTTLQEVAEHLTTRDSVELTLADVDYTQLASEAFPGFLMSDDRAAAGYLEPTRELFGWDLAEIDSKLVGVKRGAGAVATIDETELGAVDNGSLPPAAMNSEADLEKDLPRKVVVEGLFDDRDYQSGAEPAERGPDALTGRTLTINAGPAILTSDIAATLAKRTLWRQWCGRIRYRWSTLPMHLRLTPADVVDVSYQGEMIRARLTRTDLAASKLVRHDAVSDEAWVELLTATGSSGDSFIGQQIEVRSPTELFLLDIPLTRRSDDKPGLSVAVAAQSVNPGWIGALLKQSSNGTDFADLTTLTNQSPAGFCTTTLPTADPAVLDRTNSLTVTMLNGKALSSATEDDVIQHNVNLAAVGDHGRWELINFVTAAANSDGVSFTISGLVRGNMKTEHTVGTHAPGDKFVLLSGSEVSVDRPISEHDILAYYQAVSIGQPYVTEDIRSIVHEFQRITPPSVSNMEGSRDGSDNLTVTWDWRSRFGRFIMFGDPEFSEGDTRNYDIDFYDLPGGTLLRTKSVANTESVTYTAAEQTADGLTPGDPVTVEIFLVSPIPEIDRGHVNQQTL